MRVEEARELARRWAWWRAYEAAETSGERDALVAASGCGELPLWPPDRERLFAWVHGRMTAVHLASDARSRDDFAGLLALDLGISERAACDLCKAAGWP